jgi:hypothetical protein
VEDEKKRDKIQYTVPKLAPLSQGDYLVSEGAGCGGGSGFNTGTCGTGISADQCSTGSSVVYCQNGTHAEGSGCWNGLDAIGHVCMAGSQVSAGCSQGSSPIG